MNSAHTAAETVFGSQIAFSKQSTCQNTNSDTSYKWSQWSQFHGFPAKNFSLWPGMQSTNARGCGLRVFGTPTRPSLGQGGEVTSFQFIFRGRLRQSCLPWLSPEKKERHNVTTGDDTKICFRFSRVSRVRVKAHANMVVRIRRNKGQREQGSVSFSNATV